jgi:predicted glycosyltransferase
MFEGRPNVRVLQDVVDGPAAIAAADLVVGGGGTMNREAAVVGTPVWSVFNGPTPHIDDCLAAEGRLTWIRSASDIECAEDRLWERPEPRGSLRAGRDLIVEQVHEELAA